MAGRGRPRKVIPVEKVIEKEQQTNSGIFVTAGEINPSDYDNKPWSELQADYYKMRNSDALLSTTVDILKYPIMMSEYRIESPNKEIVDYVIFVLENLKKGFQYFKYHKLLALDFGLSMHEIVVKRGEYWNGKLTNYPVWFNPIQNETIFQFKYNDFTDFIGIDHNKNTPEKGTSIVNVEAKNLDWFTFNEEFNNVQGRALYRPVRLFWESKHKILISKVTATQRGAGIVSIGYDGIPTDADKGNIERIGRSICQLKNGYFTYDKSKMSVDLLEPKSNADVIQLLDYLDKQMFFNTLSQFISSGIGGNGSRAATSEHRSSYEIFASYILQEFENNLQGTVDKIIQMSCFANASEEDWPEFHLNSIKSNDLLKMSQMLKNLYDSSFLTKTPDDEKMLREMIGLPENKVVITTPLEPTEPAAAKKLSKKIRTLSKEMQDFESRVFSLQSATEHYQETSDKVKTNLEYITNVLFSDIKNQLKTNRKNDIIVKNHIIEMAARRLYNLYETGFYKGSADISTEVKKISSQTSLAAKKPIKPQKYKSIEKNVKNFFYRVKTSVESKMNQVSDKYIENNGGLDGYLQAFEMGFKNEKLNLQTEVENGYTDGRGETLLDLSDDIETFAYSAIMDVSLCDECAPYDGQIMTRDEIETAGLNLSAPINPNCLGKYHDENTCRCQIIPYSVKK